MEWNLFEDAKLVREGGHLSLFVEEVTLKSGTRPKGVDINPDLAEGSRGRIFREFLVSPIDGEYYIGNIRPGVGGAFTVPFSQLDLGDDQRIKENLFSKFGQANTSLLAVVRGTGAPGTNGVIDGGGAGIPGIILENPGLVEVECLKENLGEIGIETKGGRIGFNSSHYPDVTDFIAQEWRTSWQEILPVVVEGTISIISAPDTLILPNGEKVTNVGLTFEIGNASVEILRLHRVVLPSGRYRFRDLEHKPNGERLNRLVAAVCNGSKKLFAIYFDSGEYSERIQAIPLTGDCLDLCTNEKCKKLLSLLGWI